jgi:hypothetical protein
MISARLHTTCPGCSDPIEPGDMIGSIGLAYYCAECFEAFELANRTAPPVKIADAYPLSGTFEPEV